MKRYFQPKDSKGDSTVNVNRPSSSSSSGGFTDVSISENEETASASSVPTPSPTASKLRKYDDTYLSLGFTKTILNGEERPQCVVCLVVLAADSMKPNKLKRHLEAKHKDLIHKPREFFERKLISVKSTKKVFSNITSVPSKALMASYLVSHRIAQKKKPHTIGEELILPSAIDMVSTMFGESMAQQLKAIPMSNDTVSRRISHISDDLHAQLMEKVKKCDFALQVDEATDLHRDAHLLAYIRFIDGEELREEVLFCEPFEANTTGENIFKMIDSFLKENGMSWNHCVGICTDGARAMSGAYTGLRGLIKEVAPEARWTHCVIHREALAAKAMSPELDSVLRVIVKTVNLIKAQPLKCRLFKILCDDMGAEHSALLFHTEARWLSRGKALSRIFELRHEVLSFLIDENHPCSESFCDQSFIINLAYMADIFDKLNILNMSLQKKEANILQWTEKVKGFVRKLSLYASGIKDDNFELFPRIKALTEETELIALPPAYKECFLSHIEILKTRFAEYFLEDYEDLAWIRNPFKIKVEKCSLPMEGKENLIDIQTDATLQTKFEDCSLTKFWVSIKEEYPFVSEIALKVLIPFATTYLCESGFSTLAAMKSKYRSRLDVTKELRVALSELSPRFNKLCADKKQAHPSH